MSLQPYLFFTAKYRNRGLRKMNDGTHNLEAFTKFY